MSHRSRRTGVFLKTEATRRPGEHARWARWPIVTLSVVVITNGFVDNRRGSVPNVRTVIGNEFADKELKELGKPKGPI
jgi:hypothetical protein